MSLALRILAVTAFAALSACDRGPHHDGRPAAAPSERAIPPIAPMIPAQDDPEHEVEIAGRDGGATTLPGNDAGRLPLTRILTIARARAPGEVIEVELDDEDGRPEYEVKILTADGRSIEMKIDAVRGTILKSEED